MEGPIIAVVSTNRAYSEMLTDVLNDEGFEVIRCANRAHAHDLIRRYQPVLVLLDLWLDQPQGGEHVLASLRADPATRHIPIILCPEHMRFVEQLPALPCDTLLKPFNLDDLLHKINTFTRDPKAVV